MIPPVLQADIIIDHFKKNALSDVDLLVAMDKTKRIQFPEKESKLSKINTLCNTLSTNNVHEKSKDMRYILDSPNAVKLIAYNIVFKRIPLAQGSNGTEVFYQLVERLPQIEKPILNITYRILQNWFSILTPKA